MDNKERLIDNYNETITKLRKFIDNLRETEIRIINEKESLMWPLDSTPINFIKSNNSLLNLSESIHTFEQNINRTPANDSKDLPETSTQNTSQINKEGLGTLFESANDQNKNKCRLLNIDVSRSSALRFSKNKNEISESNIQVDDSASSQNYTDETNFQNDDDSAENSDSSEVIWMEDPSSVTPMLTKKRGRPKRFRKIKKELEDVTLKGNKCEVNHTEVETSLKHQTALSPCSSTSIIESMPRIVDSSDENEDDEISDDSVVDDEDLQLQAAIRAEKAKNKKTSTPEKTSKRSRDAKEKDSDDELEKLLRKTSSVIKGASSRCKKAIDMESDDDSTNKEFIDNDNDLVCNRSIENESDKNVLSSSERKNKNGLKKKLSSEPVFSRNNKHLSEAMSDKRSTRHTGEKIKLESDDLSHHSDNELDAPNVLKRVKNKSIDKLLKKTRALLSDSEEEQEIVEVIKKADSTSLRKRRRKSPKQKEESEAENDSENSLIVSKKNRKVTIDSSDEEGDEHKERKKTAGTVKQIMSKDKLARETLNAEKAEKERRKRLEIKQKEFNGIELADEGDLEVALTGSQKTVKLKSVILDPDQQSASPVPVAVHRDLVTILKPHQAKGIQFMYDSAFESIERLDEDGGGGILAHCMGLGKTLQVIAFLHTVLMHVKVGEKVKRALIVVPKNVVLNWFKEFSKWLNREGSLLANDLEILELDSVKTYKDRIQVLKLWHACKYPSILIIGYDLFRILTHDEDDMKKKRGPPKKKPLKNKKLETLKEEFRQYLQDPGPDIVICDEAHKLKNDESALSKAMVKIRTKRRLCLTGTPLQNNLMEYHCMVNFVKPGLLGTKPEFANRFANIINRGRLKDATPLEVKFMKRRCHVLFEHLKKCVDRKDYTVLKEAIPPKQEYVINVRLTSRQCQLYRAFLEDVVNADGLGLSKRLLPDYHVLSRVWTHPYQLVLHEQKKDNEKLLKEEADEDNDFINDGSSDDGSDSDIEILSDKDSDILPGDSDDDVPKKKDQTGTSSRKSRRLVGEQPEMEGRDTETPPEYNGWYSRAGLVSFSDQENWELSNKLILLAAILKKCEEIGDKTLVFSQSLESLSLIRRMLESSDHNKQWFADGHEACKASGENWGWKQGKDYMVIDGSVQSVKRDDVQTKFNNSANLRARLMLISTRAGSLGTNLVAANRVIIFDACWNPSHDTQSLFRVYRFGQTKPVYIYRFIAQGTMEERIYKRQVTKESTSMRVVDEAQIQRHYEGHDLDELYRFDPNELTSTSSEQLPAFAPPKDRLLADVLLSNRDAVVDYFQHDTLFAHVEEEKLSEEELKDAWDEYEREKTNPRAAFTQNNYNNIISHQQLNIRQSQPYLMTQKQILSKDPIFLTSFTIPGMDENVAMQVTYLKRALEDLLPTIPEQMRGGISEFQSFFINFISQANSSGQNSQWLLSKAVGTFRTVIKMIRVVPQCQELLRRYYISTPFYFDPTEPPLA